jgi:hypothetical protein
MVEPFPECNDDGQEVLIHRRDGSVIGDFHTWGAQRGRKIRAVSMTTAARPAA